MNSINNYSFAEHFEIIVWLHFIDKTQNKFDCFIYIEIKIKPHYN